MFFYSGIFDILSSSDIILKLLQIVANVIKSVRENTFVLFVAFDQFS